MNLDYYVYFYVDPSKPMDPFYVGKGRNGRYRDASQKQRNKHLYNKIQKLRSSGLSMQDITVFHAQNLSNTDALALEIQLIAKYGRRDQNKGKLLNYTDGGDGVSGIVPAPILMPYRDEVLKMYDERKTAREIADQFGCKSTSPVYYLLKHFGITRRSKGVMKPIIDERLAVQLYSQTPSVNRLARQFKCDHKYLKNLLIKNGVSIIDARKFGYKRKTLT